MRNPTSPTRRAEHYRLGYRPDIEGLRAVAVTLVVAAHAGLTWLEGGFIGVDVFFVLSGYLITALLVEETQRTGRLDFLDFYARRLRRLLPGLLVAILATMAAAVVLLTPWEQQQQLLNAGAATLWLSNLHFAFVEVNYFAADADSNLFLHTWSLGVEEQFYLLWPMMVLLLLRGPSAGASADMRIARLRAGLVGLVVFGFALSAWLTWQAPALAYFSPITRAWQFALGGLVMLWAHSPERGVLRLRDDDLQGRVSTSGAATTALGLLLVFGSAIAIKANMPFPGFLALAPSVGAALVLWGGAAGVGNPMARLLSVRPLPAIGKISYGWYLWHWPVFALGSTLLPLDKWLNALALTVLSFVLAMLAFRLIERPIRTPRWLQSRPRESLFIGIAAMGLVLAAVVAWGAASGRWMEAQPQRNYDRFQTDLPKLYREGCDVALENAEVVQCNYGDDRALRTAVLMGDSVAAQWFPALDEAFAEAGWRLVVFTKSGCPMVERPFFFPRLGRRYLECEQWRAEALDRAAALRPDLVLLGSAFGNYRFDREDWEEGSAAVLARIASSAGRVLLVRASPVLPFHGTNCIARNDWRGQWLPWLTQDGCHAPADSISDAEMLTGLRAAAERFDNAAVLELNDLVCPQARCYASREGRVVYRDSMHLTASFVATLSQPIAERLGLEGAPEAADIGQ